MQQPRPPLQAAPRHENNVLEAFWADNLSEDLLKKLDFVDDLKEKRLRIKKLFESCRGCGK